MSKEKYLLAGLTGLIGIALGLNMGLSLADHNFTPYSVQTRYLNEDERLDLIVRNRRGDEFIYFQQKDGSYENLDENPKCQRILPRSPKGRKNISSIF